MLIVREADYKKTVNDGLWNPKAYLQVTYKARKNVTKHITSLRRPEYVQKFSALNKERESAMLIANIPNGQGTS